MSMDLFILGLNSFKSKSLKKSLNIKSPLPISSRYSLSAIAASALLITITVSSGCTTIGNVAAPALDPMLESKADEQYSKLVETGAVSQNNAEYKRVKAITDRIIAAVATYESDVSDDDKIFSFESASNFDWEMNLLKSDDKNAFVMPGGKIAVYNGILPIAKDNDGLAAILGHEVAHALMRHGRERVVKNIGVSAALSIGAGASGASAELVRLAGMGANVGLILPWSRGDEIEADELGLVLSTIAGYEPQAAVGVWQRMAEASKGSPPEFLSTHPSHETRINNLSDLAPKYREQFQKYRNN